MAYQVGKHCYADETSAAFAACARFAPVTAILSDDDVRTVYCSSVVDRALKLGVVTTNLKNGGTTLAEILQPQTFPACTEPDLLQSWEVIAGALLGLWAVCYGVWKVRTLLHVNPRTGE